MRSGRPLRSDESNVKAGNRLCQRSMLVKRATARTLQPLQPTHFIVCNRLPHRDATTTRKACKNQAYNECAHRVSLLPAAPPAAKRRAPALGTTRATESALRTSQHQILNERASPRLTPPGVHGTTFITQSMLMTNVLATPLD